MSTSPLLLAVSHGTADGAGAAAIAELVSRVDAELPGVDVREAFVDVQEPDAAVLAPQLAGPLAVVPLLLSSGFHVHHDLHGIADTRPHTVVADPLGPDPRLAEVLALRLAQIPDAAADAPVVLAVAGSRDPRSLADAEAMTSLLAAHTGRPVHPAYLAAREPDLPTALTQHPGAVVATYLLARGYFFDLAARQASAAGCPLAPPLLDGGEVPRPLVELVAARYREAAARLHV
ncbi:sirohydrochlorin chelatase [Streptomyces sp. AC495_CC817]|uniref:sirohydrochlorin chelatase n=1 Tax=Streptomyces sp. AC495_CC817 TaxID=2823900 RepID=UPI001C27ECE4|nr:CbiX/SirB N-terminal domain-containing protein [Streptomyces sp. AC495_CC817]